MSIIVWFEKLKTSGQGKKIIITATIVLAYVLLVLPYVITIPFSIPSADDFSMGANLSYPSLIMSAFERANYCYFNFGGGIWIYMFLEVLLSPIVSYEINSMAYGITMLSIFFLTVVSLNVFYRNLFTYEIKVEKILNREILILFGTAIPLVGACYPEIFYWFDGSHYAWFMVFSLWACNYMMKYFHRGEKKINFILFSVLGMLSCSATSFTVPVTLFYIVLLYKYRRKGLRMKDFIPILFFVVGALTCILSPGVQARKEYLGGGSINIYSMINAGVMTIIGALSRLHSLFSECPCSFALLFLVFLMGIWNRGTEKKTLGTVCLNFIAPILATMGALYPVMLGYGVCAMPNRICFVFDYLFFVTMILTAFALGQYFGWAYNFEWDKSKWIMVIVLYLFVVYSSLIAGRWYPDSCWAKSIFSLADIKKEHDEWIDIFCEIEASEEKNVIVKHTRINATDILNDPQIGEDEDYWVNGAAARFFQKKSIRIEWQDPIE